MQKLLGSLLPLSIALSTGGCARTLVPLSPTVPVHPPPAGAVLEVTARAAGVTTPLRMQGGSYAWDGVEDALGRTIASATEAWATTHAAQRPDGWQLSVELSQASVRRRHGVVTVELGVRATLRTRVSHDYLAQTQVHCRSSQLVEAQLAAPVFYTCMNSVGSELAGWLGGVTP